MFSSFSSLADRNFVIAHLLPVILAALCLLGIFRDVAAVDAIWLLILDADKFAALTLLVLGLWTAAIFLMFLNLPFYRILEGYYGPLANRFTASCRDKRYTREQSSLTSQSERMGSDAKLKNAYSQTLREFYKYYPRDPTHLLPTRLGNVLRSSESYSKDVYGADSIAVWARLAGVIPDSFTTMIDGARAEMDFFVNAVFLTFFISFIASMRFLKALTAATMAGGLADFPWSFLLVSVIGFALARLWYLLAVAKALSWGECFRSAFDLYLPDLAKQLGYELPKKAEDRKKFWGKVNSLCLDQIAIVAEDWISNDQGGHSAEGREIEIIVSGRAIGK